jgi:hypothetical protein
MRLGRKLSIHAKTALSSSSNLLAVTATRSEPGHPDNGVWDNAIQFFNMQTSQALGEPVPVGADITAMAFSPDGRKLAVSTDEGVLLLYDLAVDALRQRACAVAGRKLDAAEWARYLGDRPRQEPCDAVAPTDLEASASGTPKH